MVTNVENISTIGRAFLDDSHLATLSTVLLDGTLHVVPVGFTFDAQNGIARVITSAESKKSVNARRGGTAALCQFDGAQWLTLSGSISVSTDTQEVEQSVDRYAARYLRRPRPNPARVALIIDVEWVRGSRGMVVAKVEISTLSTNRA